MTPPPDFTIEMPDGTELTGSIHGRHVGLYHKTGQLFMVGPFDLEWLRRFGVVRADDPLVMVRLELEPWGDV